MHQDCKIPSDKEQQEKYTSVPQSNCLSVYVCLSICPSTCLSVQLLAHLSIHSSVCPSIRQSVCLPFIHAPLDQPEAKHTLRLEPRRLALKSLAYLSQLISKLPVITLTQQSFKFISNSTRLSKMICLGCDQGHNTKMDF